MNCATVRSPGTRYFFLSISAMSALRAFSTMTGMRSSYLQVHIEVSVVSWLQTLRLENHVQGIQGAQGL